MEDDSVQTVNGVAIVRPTKVYEGRWECISEDNWAKIWTERRNEISCKMTCSQAAAMAVLIHKRIGMTASTYQSSRRFLERCKNEGMPPTDIILELLANADLSVSLTVNHGPSRAERDEAFRKAMTLHIPPVITVICSGEKATDSATATGDTPKETLDKAFLQLLDYCPHVTGSLQRNIMQNAAWPPARPSEYLN